MTLSKWPETDVMFVFSMRRFGIEHFFKKYSYFTITIIPEIRAANQTKASVFCFFLKKTHYEIAFARSV